MTAFYKRVSPSLVAIAIFSASYLPYPSKAASQDECAIWLCLPTGFPSGCSSAKSAMKHRIKKGKSPLPSFTECVVNSPGDQSSEPMNSNHGVAAYIPAHTTCVKWKVSGGGGKNGTGKSTCIQTESVAAQYVKGTQCLRYSGSNSSRTERPKGCTKTVNWAEVWQGKQQFGETYYW